MASVAVMFEENAHGAVAAPVTPTTSGAVSWPAIFAGATAAAALSLILLVLGTGLGLAVVSPWAARGASAEAVSWSTIIWVAFAALASSGLGGYIAGRLRSRWPSVRVDEVYFRDTAHGFLAWAVATLLTAAALTSVIGTVVGVGTVGAGVAAAGAQVKSQGVDATASQPPAGSTPSSMYFVDTLFRGAPASAATTSTPATRAEIARIFDTSIRGGGALSADDRRYVADVVTQGTGLSAQEADARVMSTYGAEQTQTQQAEARARAAADQARKAGVYTALWLFVSLLGGAFFASLMATWGGRRRDMA